MRALEGVSQSLGVVSQIRVILVQVLPINNDVAGQLDVLQVGAGGWGQAGSAFAGIAVAALFAPAETPRTAAAAAATAATPSPL